jgi:LAO/AO transport system kinase
VESSSEIARRLVEGDRTALTRLISWAENAHPSFPRVLAEIYPRVGHGWRTGITGPPGCGKSTLTNALVGEHRRRGDTVGVLAIDPSSPFSGGALLGDRIRMEERTGDAGVYIRSMATREARGGLARAAVDACDVMDAFGFAHLLIETVGVGQGEYEVVSAADTIVVVLCPGAGDGIQALKAGILEVGDVLVVNKSDLDGAEQLALDLEDAVRLRAIRRDARPDAWRVPVVACSARHGEGVERVLEALDAHRAWSTRGDLARTRAAKRAAQVQRVVRERLEDELWSRRVPAGWVESSLRGSTTPYDVAEEILRSTLRADGGVGQAAGAKR